VVDASVDNDTKDYVSALSESCYFDTIYIKQKYGYLTHARNIGIKVVSGDVVVFLDNDTILYKDYLENIVDIFRRDKDKVIGGVQGHVVGRKEFPLIIRLIDHFFLIDSPRKGMVSVIGSCSYPIKVEEVVSVMWLSGSNMCFRRCVFDDFSFNEEISCTYNSSRYRFVGEDKEFSHRVSKKYTIVLNPKAKLVHKGERSAWESTSVLNNCYGDYLICRRYWFRNFYRWNPFYEFLFWWGQFGYFISSFVKHILRDPLKVM